MNLIETPAVHARAIEAAERLLRSVGVLYAIQMPDGSARGALPIAPPPGPTKRTRAVPVGFWKRHFLPFLQDLRPGGLAVVPAPEGHSAADLQGPISAWCSSHFGRGQFMTTVDGETVQVLRMEAGNG